MKRPGILWWVWRLLTILLMVGGMLSPSRAEDSVRRFDKAVFTPAACGRDVQTASQQVMLPDVWHQRGQHTPGTGCYAFILNFTRSPQHILSLRLDSLSARHRVLINHRLLSNHGSRGKLRSVRSIITTRLLELPPDLLHAGDNLLQIEVAYDNPSRAGISYIEMGPDSLLRWHDTRQRLLEHTVPQALNLATAVLAVLLLVIWLVRKRERAIGIFGLLLMLASLRNFFYFSERPLLSITFSDVLMFLMQIWTFVLLIAFVNELLQRQAPRTLRALIGTALAFTLLAGLASGLHQMPMLRRCIYPLLLLGLCWPIYLLIRSTCQTRNLFIGGLAAGLILLTLAGTHDYLLVTGHTGIHAVFWIPFGVPTVLAAFSLILVKRFVEAMIAIESLHEVLEARVAERTAALERSNAAKSRFLAAASHDLLQPLFSMKLAVGSLACQTGQPIQRGLAHLQHALEALENMLRGVLDLSRLETGCVSARPVSMSIRPIVEAVCATLGTQADKKGLVLRARIQNATIVSDPVLLQAILSNLAGNAIKYTDHGGVLIGIRQRSGALRVEIWDTGCGIAEADLARIFDEFYRISTVKSQSPGFGLGLSIAERYARMLGHRLHVRSRPGKGSCFAIELTPATDTTGATPTG